MRILIAIALAASLALPARAELKVVGSLPILASLAKEIGGDRIAVEALAKGTQDPHYVEARPSLMLTLNRADLLLYVGMELEIGWLPPLILGSRNPRIQTGEPGNLDCSQAIEPLDIPTTLVNRSMGDIHPQGNPHYWLPPHNALRLTKLIAERLAQLDPEGRPTFEANRQRFEKQVAAKELEWRPRLARLRGVKVATYHRSWSYVVQWLKLVEVGEVEPKPGIPPDPAHLLRLIHKMRAEKASLLLVESFYNRSIAATVAEKSGARLVVLPTDVGAEAKIRSWAELVEAVLDELGRDLS